MMARHPRQRNRVPAPQTGLEPGQKILFLTRYGEGFNPGVLSRKVNKFIKQADRRPSPEAATTCVMPAPPAPLEGSADI